QRPAAGCLDHASTRDQPGVDRSATRQDVAGALEVDRADDVDLATGKVERVAITGEEDGASVDKTAGRNDQRVAEPGHRNCVRPAGGRYVEPVRADREGDGGAAGAVDR